MRQFLKVSTSSLELYRDQFILCSSFATILHFGHLNCWIKIRKFARYEVLKSHSKPKILATIVLCHNGICSKTIKLTERSQINKVEINKNDVKSLRSFSVYLIRPISRNQVCLFNLERGL